MHQEKMLISNKLDLVYLMMNCIAFYLTKLLSVNVMSRSTSRVMTIHITNIGPSNDHGSIKQYFSGIVCM